jgi:acyl-CoA thioesterase FadM
MTLRVLDCDAKRVHIWHEMYLDDSDVLLAAAEQMLVHVDSRAARSAPMPADLAERMTELQSAHRALPLPDGVGRPMRIRRG